MSAPRPDPSHVGRALPPPAVVLPDPASLFARRADRFAALAATHPLGPYLAVLGGIARAQHAVCGALPAVVLPSGASLSREHGMPPLARSPDRLDDVAQATLDAVFEAIATLPMPAEATAALESHRLADPPARRRAVVAVLDDAIPADDLAGHAFVAAGLQVHFARLAAALPATGWARGATGICPACGGPPVASLVVGWPGAENARYCVCALCATAWNVVRVTCTACGSTEGIGYRSREDGDGGVKAECCDACRSYVKVLYQTLSPGLEPVADDVASLDLDLLLRDGPYRRAAFNPYLLGG